MKTWWHRLMHKLCLTSGYVDHEKDADGVWWIGLRCGVCGKLMHPFKSKFQDNPTPGQGARETDLKI